MSFVLEHDQPFLIMAAHVRIHDDTAGIYLLRLIEVIEQPLLFQRLRTNHSNIHERHVTRLIAIKDLPILLIHLIGLLESRRVLPLCKLRAVEYRGECRMPAMI